MSGVVANPPADLGELRPDDEMLAAEELRGLSLFNSEHFEKPKNAPSFDRFPGATVLRSFRAGDLVCEQGDAGASAFYILTRGDLMRLRQVQLTALRKVQEARAAGRSEDGLHAGFARLDEEELARHERELLDELLVLQNPSEEAGSAAEGDRPGPQRVASARLLVDREAGAGRKGLLHRLIDPFRRSSRLAKATEPDSIPIDAPTDLDARSLEAPLHEGDLFGEMSCMNRSPRSATVVVERDCYMLEMLRNVLDMLHKDAKYKQRMDALYRERVLETHVRRLSIFRELSDAEFARLRDSIELLEYESGRIIFEEHDPSDAFYVIRSGLVKVVKNVGTRLRDEEFDEAHWRSLCEQIAEAGNESEEEAALREPIRNALSGDALAIARRAAERGELGAADRDGLLVALNDFIRHARVEATFGKTTAEIVDSIDADRLREVCRDFPEKPQNWSELEARLFHRELLETAFPGGIPRRLAHSGPREVLAYLGRGDTLGEIGVVLDAPRSATCVAYDHPETWQMRIPDSRTGAVVSRVELLRIERTVFEELMRSSERLRKAVETTVAQLRRRDESRSAAGVQSIEAVTQSLDFERLGLIQGQKLMLIDLDRCTRCGACVDACIDTHADGHARLYLDGPRFEKYLVPLTCRSCLDPVCMIGCPVGAINRGDDGEIRIRDWCIGCRVCAEQCPYGSIQMNELAGSSDPSRLVERLQSGASIKKVSKRAVVCDLCSSLSVGEPACVYSCPHDAALRVNAAEFFFEVVPSKT